MFKVEAPMKFEAPLNEILKALEWRRLTSIRVSSKGTITNTFRHHGSARYDGAATLLCLRSAQRDFQLIMQPSVSLTSDLCQIQPTVMLFGAPSGGKKPRYIFLPIHSTVIGFCYKNDVK